MTIRITLSNPAEHQSGELRALALLFNTLAADLDSGAIKYVPAYRAANGLAIATHEVPAAAAPLAQTTTGAHGASTGPVVESGAGAPAAGTTSELDSAGVKWDARIHSESRSTNKDGTWRQKRGVDQALVGQILAEQQAGGSDAPEIPKDETPPPVEDEAPELPEDEAPEVPEETPPPVVADVKPADVIKFITTHKLDTATVNELLASMGTGLTKAADLFAKADQAPAALAMLETLVG